jgi:peroxiredoxin
LVIAVAGCSSFAVGSSNQPTLAPPVAWTAPTPTPDDSPREQPTPVSTPTPDHAPDEQPAPAPTPTDAPNIAPPPVGVEKGHTAPDFELKDIEGQPVRLSDYRGQVVLVNFWAIWCGYCRVEMPVLQAAYDRYQDSGFVVLAVDIMDRKASVVEYVREAGLTFPVLLDDSGQVSTQYRVRGLPTSFFVDQNGVIQETHIGPIDDAMLEDILAQLGVH